MLPANCEPCPIQGVPHFPYPIHPIIVSGYLANLYHQLTVADVPGAWRAIFSVALAARGDKAPFAIVLALAQMNKAEKRSRYLSINAIISNAGVEFGGEKADGAFNNSFISRNS